MYEEQKQLGDLAYEVFDHVVLLGLMVFGASLWAGSGPPGVLGAASLLVML